MLDFTSALYLDLQHPSRSLRAWDALSLGRPAALEEPPGAEAVATRLAALLGCDAATLLPSTLHLFWDLFGVLVPSVATTIVMDADTYPIVRWGVERATRLGVRTYTFPHHDPEALRDRLAQVRSAQPVVVTDGFCPRCGRVAPLAAYAEIVRSRDGYLVIDDTQALGILGRAPSHRAPYGHGGGGVLRWSGIAGPHVIVGASLAKGFGVPIAVLAGSRAMVRRFRMHSDTRVHCSPPSVAAVAATERALAVNQDSGDLRRDRLLTTVRRFQYGVERVGLSTVGGLFPVQTLRPDATYHSGAVHRELLRRGVRAVLHRARAGAHASISLLMTAGHDRHDVDQAVEALGRALVAGCGQAAGDAMEGGRACHKSSRSRSNRFSIRRSTGSP